MQSGTARAVRYQTPTKDVALYRGTGKKDQRISGTAAMLRNIKE